MDRSEGTNTSHGGTSRSFYAINNSIIFFALLVLRRKSVAPKNACSTGGSMQRWRRPRKALGLTFSLIQQHASTLVVILASCSFKYCHTFRQLGHLRGQPLRLKQPHGSAKGALMMISFESTYEELRRRRISCSSKSSLICLDLPVRNNTLIPLQAQQCFPGPVDD